MVNISQNINHEAGMLKILGRNNLYIYFYVAKTNAKTYTNAEYNTNKLYISVSKSIQGVDDKY